MLPLAGLTVVVAPSLDRLMVMLEPLDDRTVYVSVGLLPDATVIELIVARLLPFVMMLPALMLLVELMFAGNSELLTTVPFWSVLVGSSATVLYAPLRAVPFCSWLVDAMPAEYVFQVWVPESAVPL
jgi:hypothetical protein